jgi:cysteine desulfurase
MAVDRARQQVAALVGRDPRALVFTSGATEANALALHAAAGEGTLLVSAVEHPSVLAWSDHQIPVDADGVVRLDALDRLLGGPRRFSLVSVMAASNESGVIQPIAEISRLCRAHGVPLHCDATQAPGRVAIPVEPELLTLSAHKFGGPKGVGLLVSALGLRPLLRGGSQERGRRGGTLNVPGIVGMGVAAAGLERCLADDRDRIEALARLHGARVVGAGAPRLPNTSLLLFPEPGDLIVMALDLEGVQTSTGAACASGAAEASPALRAMGLSGVPVRFSLGPGNDVGLALSALGRVLRQIRGDSAPGEGGQAGSPCAS